MLNFQFLGVDGKAETCTPNQAYRTHICSTSTEWFHKWFWLHSAASGSGRRTGLFFTAQSMGPNGQGELKEMWR